MCALGLIVVLRVEMCVTLQKELLTSHGAEIFCAFRWRHHHLSTFVNSSTFVWSFFSSLSKSENKETWLEERYLEVEVEHHVWLFLAFQI